MTNTFDLTDVRTSWSFTLPVNIPSANLIKRAAWNGDRTYQKRLRQEFAWAIKLKAQWVPKATGPRKVTITRLIAKGGRRYDADNLVAACKGLLDELTLAGLIQGDAEHQVTVEYQQERASDGLAHVRVEIEEV